MYNSTYTYVYITLYYHNIINVYIYIYIEREREIEKEREILLDIARTGPFDTSRTHVGKDRGASWVHLLTRRRSKLISRETTTLDLNV